MDRGQNWKRKKSLKKPFNSIHRNEKENDNIATTQT